MFMADPGLKWFEVSDFWHAGPSQREKVMDDTESSTVKLLKTLCATPSHVDHATDRPQNEQALAAFILGYLKDFPWLEAVADEIPGDRYNIFATDVPEEHIELLILSHLDTAGPLEGWSHSIGASHDGRFYGAGVANTKGAMVALLEAMHRAGPTKGVGYLFYSDAEYGMLGMDHFLHMHPSVSPRIALSTGGPSASLLTGCRGVLEFQISMRGVGAHVSRQDLGCNAIEALNHVMIGLARFCDQQQNNTPWHTTFNLAAMKGGALELASSNSSPAARYSTSDKIPDQAWAHVVIFPGSPKLNRTALESQIRYLMESFNAPRRDHVRAAITDLRFLQDRNGYSATEQDLKDLVECFNDVHQDRRTPANAFGYTDAAQLSVERNTSVGCVAPLKGNERAADEFVDLVGINAYRQACARLLSRFSARL